MIQSLESEASAGHLLRGWRKARGLSQMALALDVGVSPRHLSFVETGRSRPSRELLFRLADRLSIPGREENLLLEAAGHARRYRESRISDPELEQVRKVLAFLLERHEPNSALVFDRDWDIVMSNEAHQRSVGFFLGESERTAGVLDNLLRLTFHPEGLRPYIANWAVVAPVLVRRVEQELAEAPHAKRLKALLEEVRAYGRIPPLRSDAITSTKLLLPIRLVKGEVDVELFSVLSTIGSATDVMLQGLRVESFFPADARSEAVLASLNSA